MDLVSATFKLRIGISIYAPGNDFFSFDGLNTRHKIFVEEKWTSCQKPFPRPQKFLGYLTMYQVNQM